MKKTLMIILLFCIITGITANVSANTNDKQTFSDVPINHWAYPYITDMVERGVLNGYSDGTFQPDKPVTRAEAAKMIACIELGATDISSRFPEQLTDVPKDSWYAKYVAVTQNYFNKYLVNVNGKMKEAAFAPEGYAEREDIVVALIKQMYNFGYDDKMILNESQLDSWEYDYTYDKYILSKSSFDYKSYADYSEITPEKLPYFEKALSLGILTGYENNTLCPRFPVSRAEMATLMYKIYGDKNATNIVFGKQNYTIDCTIDEFVTRYNKSIMDNAKNIYYDEYDNFILEQLYLNKVKIEKTGDNSDRIEKKVKTSYSNFSGNSVIWVDNSTGKIAEIEWDRYRLYSNDTTIQNKNLQEFDSICFLMAILNITYDEACNLSYVISNNGFFFRSGNVLFLKDDGKPFYKNYKKLHIMDLSAMEDVDLGLYSEKENSGKHISTNNSKIGDFILKYNTNVYENFKYICDDLKYISPENLLLSDKSLISEFTPSNEKFRYSIDYGSDFYGYTIGNISFICNTKNEILSVSISSTDIVWDKQVSPTEYSDDRYSANSNSNKIDFSNLESICLIQALEDISYEEARRYFFAIIAGNEFTSAKGNIYSYSYGQIRVISEQYFIYAQNLEEQYYNSL